MQKEEIGKELFWTRSWIRRREERGVYHQLIRELALDDVALKVSGGGVTRTNTNKIRATMLQGFESLSKTCNMLLQQNVALKIALCTLLHEATFNATMLRFHFTLHKHHISRHNPCHHQHLQTPQLTQLLQRPFA